MKKNSMKKNYPKEQKHPLVVYIIVAILILFPLIMFFIKHRLITKNRIQKPVPGIQLQQQDHLN